MEHLDILRNLYYDFNIFLEFKHDPDDTNDRGVSSDGAVRKQKQFFGL